MRSTLELVTRTYCKSPALTGNRASPSSDSEHHLLIHCGPLFPLLVECRARGLYIAVAWARLGSRGLRVEVLVRGFDVFVASRR